LKLHRWVVRKLLHWGVPSDSVDLASSAVILAFVLLVAFLAHRLTRRFIEGSLGAVARRTDARWDDLLIERRVFQPLAHLAPALVFLVALPAAFAQVEDARDLIRRGALIYMVLVTATVVDRLLGALVDLYEMFDAARQRPPIKSYTQVLKILNYLVVGILLISIAGGQSPAVLLGGLGALSAVLLLVFRDPLLGLVASVQLSANDMIRRGDPIEVPKFGVEGEVIDMSLTMVKVQTPDRSVAMLPNHVLVSEAFRNSRNIRDSGVRRLKRTLWLDVTTVRFLSEKPLTTLIDDAHMRALMFDLPTLLSTEYVTNLAIYRAYVKAFTAAHPRIASDLPVFVRELAPDVRGIAIELNCFVRELDYPTFESIQASIMEHLIAMTPRFGLRLARVGEQSLLPPN
jgi:miniconductance mechanosensitive channel